MSSRNGAVAEPDPVRRNRFAEEHDLDPSQTFTSWEELIAAGAVAIVDPMTSSMVTPILEVATAAKIPLVSPTATSSTLTGKTFGADARKDSAARFSLSLRYHEVGP